MTQCICPPTTTLMLVLNNIHFVISVSTRKYWWSTNSKNKKDFIKNTYFCYSSGIFYLQLADVYVEYRYRFIYFYSSRLIVLLRQVSNFVQLIRQTQKIINKHMELIIYDYQVLSDSQSPSPLYADKQICTETQTHVFQFETQIYKD